MTDSMWMTCDHGRWWGPDGAAGLMVVIRDRSRILVQQRAIWTHNGGTFSIPGGALHPAETPFDAAVREAAEEGVTVNGLTGESETVASVVHEPCEHWSYTTFLVEADPGDVTAIASSEADSYRWVDVGNLTSLPLHPGFQRTLAETDWVDIDIDAPAELPTGDANQGEVTADAIPDETVLVPLDAWQDYVMFDAEQDIVDLLSGNVPASREDLAPFFDEAGGMPVIRHPLSVGLSFDLPPKAREMGIPTEVEKIGVKAEKLVEYASEGRWWSLVFLIERPYRPVVLSLMTRVLPDHGADPAAVARLLVDWWSDGEGQHGSYWEMLTQWIEQEVGLPAATSPTMTRAEFPVTIWRGISVEPGGLVDDVRPGRSWTFNRAQAVWFAHRWARDTGNEPHLLRATLPSADVVLFSTDARGEAEVVVIDHLLDDVTVEPL